MIVVGIDPGFMNTGLVVLSDMEKVLFSGLLQTKKRKSGWSYKLVVESDLWGDVKYRMEEDLRSIRVIEESEGDTIRIVTHATIVSRFLTIVSEVCGADKRRVWIEIPFGAHRGAGAKVDRVYAAVIMGVFMSKISCVPQAVSPATVKKFITGKGNAKKEMVAKEVFKRWRFDTDYLDVADAYAVARYGIDNERSKIIQEIMTWNKVRIVAGLGYSG